MEMRGEMLSIQALTGQERIGLVTYFLQKMVQQNVFQILPHLHSVSLLLMA